MMNLLQKIGVFLALFTMNPSQAQGYKIETGQGFEYIADPMICNGRHWTEAQGKEKMKEFSELWTDANSWEKRAKTIKQNILKGNGMG